MLNIFLTVADEKDDTVFLDISAYYTGDMNMAQLAEWVKSLFEFHSDIIAPEVISDEDWDKKVFTRDDITGA